MLWVLIRGIVYHPNVGRAIRKHVFGYMWTVKAQISLLILISAKKYRGSPNEYRGYPRSIFEQNYEEYQNFYLKISFFIGKI